MYEALYEYKICVNSIYAGHIINVEKGKISSNVRKKEKKRKVWCLVYAPNEGKPITIIK